MTRQPVEVAGVVLPASYRTDTSVERDFFTTDEPSTVGCTLAVGDKWYKSGTPTPPPPPPTTTVPFVVGQDKPSAKTNGLGPRIATVTKTLTDMAGVAAGQVVRGWHVTGFPTLKAGAYYVDCEFTANATTSTRLAKLESSSSQPTTYLVNCKIDGDTYAHVWAGGAGTHDIVMLHCDITGTDGVDSGYSTPANANVYVYASKMRLRPFYPDPSHANGWSHSDCWQIVGGANHGAIGSEFVTTDLTGGTVPNGTTGDPYAQGHLTCVMVTQNYSGNPISNVAIDSCWFDSWCNIDNKGGAFITGHINDSYWQYPAPYSPNGYASSEINFGVNNNSQLTQSGNQRWLGGSWGPIRLTGAKK